VAAPSVDTVGAVAAYQSLYRKYRPQRFAELVGQEHVTAALRNAVRDGRVGHAYLFSGPRGTGKTTTARILAKALNCLNLGGDGEPCGECDHCRAVAEGTFLDLFELDAASNRGVNDARDLLERIAYRGATGGKKVYILDEVHMLTDAAANTLLKSLEEPPEHVAFVLATTNPEQVLPTIRSRTQHFEFSLLTMEQLTVHLADICERESVEAEPEALALVARAGRGSVRDALSLLDQVLAHSPGRLVADEAAAILGGSPFDRRVEILRAVGAEDPATALVVLHDLLDSGHEPRRVAEELLGAARDAFLLTVGGGRVSTDVPLEAREPLAEVGTAIGGSALVRLLETLGQAVVDMRGVDAADPRLVLEVALVRLARHDAGPPLASLAARVERLEARLAGEVPSPAPALAPPVASADEAPAGAPRSPGRALGAVRTPREAPVASAPPAPTAPPDAPPTRSGPPPTLDDVVLAWADVLPMLPVATRAAVSNAQPIRVEDDVVIFGIAPADLSVAKERFRLAADVIRQALSDRLGRTLRFRLVESSDFALAATPDPPPPPAAPILDEEPPPTPDEFDAAAFDPGEFDQDAGTRAVSSFGLLEQAFDAVVVEEVPRDGETR
jgi:DNA polymerase-3 subunit gamma/tau